MSEFFHCGTILTSQYQISFYTEINFSGLIYAVFCSTESVITMNFTTDIAPSDWFLQVIQRFRGPGIGYRQTTILHK